MRKWLIRIAVLVALVAAFFVLKATVLAPDPVPVLVVPVDVGEVEETVTNSRAGTVTARRRAKLSPEIGGQVVELPYREGDRVTAGSVVLRIEDSAQKARLDLALRDHQAAVAERERTCLTADRAAREYDRMARLAQESIVSTDLLDQAESSRDAGRAACRAAEATEERVAAAVGVARAELAKTVLRAPFDGIVAEVSTEVGEWTTPSPPALPVPPVIDILDPASIYVSAPMDEVDSARIAPEQPVRVTVDSHRGRSFPGSVRRVAPYVLDIEEQNRTVEIEVVFDDPALAASLLPGTSADVEVILEVEQRALRIPTATLVEGGRVLVLAGGVLEERGIETGLRNWDYTQVLDGLAEGELVVESLDRAEVRDGAEAVAVEELSE
jgi:HlyD family secretion protein